MIRLKIEGMSCAHCSANVEKALLKIEGIDKASVDHMSGIAFIEGENINMDEIDSAVKEAGYSIRND